MADGRSESAVVTNDVVADRSSSMNSEGCTASIQSSAAKQIHFIDLTSVQLTVLSYEEENVKAQTHKQMSTEGSHSKGLARQLEGDFW